MQRQVLPIQKSNGSIVDLTCGQKNHGLHHFLLCDKETCCNKSELFWQHRKARCEIVHLLMVEDVDYSDIEGLEPDLD